MDQGLEFFGRNADDPLKQKEAAKQQALKLLRTFSEVFGTPNGREALKLMRIHLVGEVALFRGQETPNATCRRDALRDVYFWIEGYVQRGERMRETVLED